MFYIPGIEVLVTFDKAVMLATFDTILVMLGVTGATLIWLKVLFWM